MCKFMAKLVGCVAAVAMVLSVAGTAHAENLPTESLANTAWGTVKVDALGNKVLQGMVFRADGKIVLINTVGGKVVKSEGEYALGVNSLILSYQGMHVATLKVVTFDGEFMIVESENGSRTAWVRIRG